MMVGGPQLVVCVIHFGVMILWHVCSKPEETVVVRQWLCKHDSTATKSRNRSNGYNRNNRITFGGGDFHTVRAEAIYRGPNTIVSSSCSACKTRFSETLQISQGAHRSDICTRLPTFPMYTIYKRPWRPIRLWDVEPPTFSRQSAHRWRWGSQPYAPAALHPQEDSWYSLLRGSESTAGPCADRNIRSTEKSNGLIENRTHDLPACSIVP
jgi:hypothetical protein